MAKEDAKESVADRVAREKAEKEKLKAAEEAEAKKAAELKAAEEDNDDQISAEELDAIENSDEDPDTGPIEAFPDKAASAVLAAKKGLADAAVRKLRLIAVAYPQTTPDEHVIFGFGGHIFHLGDLRSLFGIPGPRG